MDSDESCIPSELLDSEPIPSSSSADIEDARIICTNHQSLHNIVKLTADHVSELADSLNLNDDRSNFITQFNESFRNALQENIVIDGLPWMMNQETLTSPQKEDQKQMIDNVLLSRLSEAVSKVANKRKFCPSECRRIYKMKTKHELQNLKKAEAVGSTTLPEDSSKSFLNRCDTKPFIDFCKEYQTLQKNVQELVQKEEKFERQRNFAYNLRNHH